MVAGRAGTAHELHLRLVRRDRLGKERLPSCQELVADRLRCSRRVNAMTYLVAGPALCCDQVGVDKRDAGPLLGEDKFYEGRFPGAVRADDEVKTAHRAVVDPSG